MHMLIAIGIVLFVGLLVLLIHVLTQLNSIEKSTDDLAHILRARYGQKN